MLLMLKSASTRFSLAAGLVMIACTPATFDPAPQLHLGDS